MPTKKYQREERLVNLHGMIEVEISKGKKVAQCRLMFESTQCLLRYREQFPITAEPLICELLRADTDFPKKWNDKSQH